MRSANLARIYQDVGMVEVSAREASRAVANDYGNYSAHLFLANSYDALRDPKQVNLRYETPWLSEYLIANLLAPVGAGSLSPTISQGEYSRLFDADHFGIVSVTEYLSRGDWIQGASQYGTVGNSSYAVEVGYRSENGERRNQDQEQLALVGQFKQQLTPQDTLFLQAIYSDFKGGDLAQYYDQNKADPSLRLKDRQEPLLLAGFHHEWAPGVHTLFLGGRLQDTFFVQTTNQINLLTSDFSRPGFFTNTLDYRAELEIYTAELQQIWQGERHGLILGGRYQVGEFDTESRQSDPSALPNFFPVQQHFENDFGRVSLYAYDNWHVVDSLLLTAGVSYDRVHFPENFRFAPLNHKEDAVDRVSPKAGLIWTPTRSTTVRGAYTRSLGGVSFDQSFRLEPTQVGGFSQAFRSLIPEALIGAAAVPTFETWGLGVDQKCPTGTYLGVEGEVLRSKVHRDIGGGYDFDPFSTTTIITPFTLRERLKYKETSLSVNAHQLLGEQWALGARYRVSKAELEREFDDHIDPKIAGAKTETEASIHQVNLFVLFHHSCGFFARGDSIWYNQHNEGPERMPGDDFWQFNVFAGYRFLQRRIEAGVGLLNITDQDYRLNPLNVSRELPRSRTLTASLKLSF